MLQTVFEQSRREVRNSLHLFTSLSYLEQLVCLRPSCTYLPALVANYFASRFRLLGVKCFSIYRLGCKVVAKSPLASNRPPLFSAGRSKNR